MRLYHTEYHILRWFFVICLVLLLSLSSDPVAAWSRGHHSNHTSHGRHALRLQHQHSGHRRWLNTNKSHTRASFRHKTRHVGHPYKRYVGYKDHYYYYRSRAPFGLGNKSIDRYTQTRDYDWTKYSDERGWDLLNRRKPRKALSIFALQSEFDINSGEPKVGFALAAAMTGAYDRGVWSMRRALRVDPNSLKQLTFSDKLQRSIVKLIDAYKLKGNTDAMFMVAALQYLLNNRVDANAALGEVLSQGDKNESTHNLKRLLAF